MKNLIVLLSMSVCLFSCVSKDEYDKLSAEKHALEMELQDLKFGAPSLLADAKTFFKAHDFTRAKEKLDLLLNKHGDRPESAEGRSMLLIINEEKSWANASTSSDISSTETYLSSYPKGRYIKLARNRLEELKIAKEKSDYESALTQNSSSAWKAFMARYPYRSDLEEIKSRIIRCEVDEIMGSSETGKLPTSDLTSYDNSSSSAVVITNGTGCDLTVRYSGEDAKMIEIAANATQTINLSSGTYKIAASACNANYAGTEELHGNYTSRYYIVRY